MTGDDLHIETCAKIKIIKGFAHQSSTKVARCVSEQNTLKWQRDLYNTVCVTQYPANCQKLFRLYVSSFLSVFKKNIKSRRKYLQVENTSVPSSFT